MKAMILVLAAFVTACTSAPDHHITREESMAITKRNNSVSEYVTVVQQRYTSFLPPETKFHGKTCTLHLQLNRSAQLLHAEILKGDKEFCAAALQAAKDTEYPSFYENTDYEILKSIIMDVNG